MLEYNFQWAAFKKQKPLEEGMDPHQEALLKQAEGTVGDFKLKSAADYKVPKEKKESTVKKYKQLLNARRRVSTTPQTSSFDKINRF